MHPSTYLFINTQGTKATWSFQNDSKTARRKTWGTLGLQFQVMDIESNDLLYDFEIWYTQICTANLSHPATLCCYHHLLSSTSCNWLRQVWQELWVVSFSMLPQKKSYGCGRKVCSLTRQRPHFHALRDLLDFAKFWFAAVARDRIAKHGSRGFSKSRPSFGFQGRLCAEALSPYTNVLRSFGQDVEPIILEMPGKVRPFSNDFAIGFGNEVGVFGCSCSFLQGWPNCWRRCPETLRPLCAPIWSWFVLTLACVRPSDVCLCHGCARSKPIKEWKACIWKAVAGAENQIK